MREVAEGSLVARILLDWPDAVAIYAFGSAGGPGERADSDIDLAILPNLPGLPGARLWEVAQELARMAHRDVDLVDLSTASTVLKASPIASAISSDLPPF